MKNLSFDEWYELAFINYYRDENYYEYQRLGQFFYNQLFNIKPAMTQAFIDGVLEPDPFYKDTNLDRFLDTVRKNWDSYD